MKAYDETALVVVVVVGAAVVVVVGFETGSNGISINRLS